MRVVTGFHAIEELLRTGAGTSEGAKPQLLYSKPGPRIKKILEDAKKRGIPAKQTTDRELDKLTANLSETARNHRGLVLTISGEAEKKQNFVQFDTFAEELSKKDKALVVILDSITDPHNTGAIIRSCDQFGADLVVIPEHRGVSESDVKMRSSAGAAAWVPVAVVQNLNRSVEFLKQRGFWVYGADADGQSARQTEFAAKTALVMGSEGSGIAQLLRKNCDAIVSIPTCGKLDSLNVSVATGVLLYEISGQLQQK
ncbi:MAG: 23S rRNA (guanosine(2251)-2'-O)-methyltransferase RlmB [Spirochaetaceae bacterium]|nr:23S rRNA (guanosine(2251)-2'-O)-methyltransferase RlmB [Spirochaetaceae bacterium]